jgi:hypothetical protein
MKFGGISTRILDSSPTTVKYTEKSKIKSNTEKLHKDLDTLGEWVVENGMKTNPGKSKAMRFTTARVRSPLGYSFGDQKIPETSSC